MIIKEINMHYACDSNSVPASFIVEYVKDADIIVFTEMKEGLGFQTFEKLLMSYGIKYFFYSPPRNNNNYNQVCIAVKKGFNPKQIIDLEILSSITDFVHVEIESKGIKYNIIGNRICVDIEHYQEKKDFIFRKNQALKIVGYASKYQNAIVIGDQNTAMMDYRDDLNLEYEECKHFYKGKSREFYNIHMMKQICEDNDMEMNPPINESSSGLYYDGENILAANYNSNVLNIDFAYTNAALTIKQYYSWDFLYEHQEEYKTHTQIFKSWIKCEHGYPDHAILTVSIAEE